jgi:hypothetical protein
MVTVSSQLRMFRREGDPATVLHPYVPILLAKLGERMALERMPPWVWDSVTPCIRIVPPELRDRTETDPPPAEIARIARAAGDHVVYLDPVGAPRRRRRIAPLGVPYVRQVYETALASDLAFAPIYPFRRRDLGPATAEFAVDGIGAAVLVPKADAIILGTGRLDLELREEVRSLGIEVGRLDAIVDLGYISPGATDAASVVWLVRQVMVAAPWRSVILAGTSIPDSLSTDIPDGSLNGIERRERALFDAVQRQVDSPLRYGDYAVQHPVPPASGPVPKMRASIRYTAGDFTFVSRGGQPIGEMERDQVAGEYQRLAEQLVLHPPFDRKGCCWGDQFIEELANGTRTARGQRTLRAVATCHHLTVVAGERSRMAVPAVRKTAAVRGRIGSTSRSGPTSVTRS